MLTTPSVSGQRRGRFEFVLRLPKGYFISAFFAVALHAGLFFVWPDFALLESPEHGVKFEESSVEVMLVAASSTLEESPNESREPPPSLEHFESRQPPGEVAEERPPAAATSLSDATTETSPQLNQVQESKSQPSAGSSSAIVSAKPKAPIAHERPMPAHGTSVASRSRPIASAIAGGGSSKPEYLFNPHPAYPELSRKAGHSGVVILRASVGESGRVSAVSVIKSSGHAVLDERARATVRRWIFRPARWNGRPVATQVDVPVRFSLDR